MDDERIIELFFARSESAIAELSAKYGAACLRAAQNVLRDRRDAEECVSDACLAVWNTVPPLRPDSLRAYLCGIVRNLALKRCAENTAQKRNPAFEVALDEIADCLPASSSVEEQIDANELARSINGFLGTLDRESRVLFIRRWWKGESIDALAALLGTGRHNVSVRLSRLRKKLKKYLILKGELSGNETNES